MTQTRNHRIFVDLRKAFDSVGWNIIFNIDQDIEGYWNESQRKKDSRNITCIEIKHHL